MGVPPIIYFNGIFHYKLSSYWGTSIYGNPQIDLEHSEDGHVAYLPWMPIPRRYITTGQVAGLALAATTAGG